MADKERSRKTEYAYSKRAIPLLKSLFKYMMKRYGQNVVTTQEILVEWFLLHTKDLNSSTFRQYKNSLAYYYERTDNNELETALRSLTRTDNPQPKPKTRRTSAMKTKKVTVKDERAITKCLLEHASNSGGTTLSNRTYVYFKSTIMTGLRPSEWVASRLKSNYTMPDGTVEKIVLIVKNGKASNGRSHGEYRHVILSELSANEVSIIALHMKFLYKYLMDGGKFNKYYDACRGKLNRTCKLLWPNRKTRVSLYSGRHQFSANQKASGATRPEVAAVMGHATDATAAEHYGKKKAGRRGPIARSASHEVKRVRLVFDSPFAPRRSSGPRLG